MECPRCDNKWDGKKTSSPLCGFINALPNQVGNSIHLPANPQKGTSAPPAPKPGSGNLSFGTPPIRKPSRLAHFPTNPLDKEASPAQPKQTTPLSHVQPAQGPYNSAEITAKKAQPLAPGTLFRNYGRYRLREVQAQPLAPGTLLRNGRYRLREVQESQEWLDGVFEATWSAQDVFQGGTLVSIRELAFLETSSEGGRSILRTATTALLAIGRHPRVPALRDAFNDQGRSFFVFEHMEGESLQARLQYSGRPLEEQEVIEICLQMSEILELQAEQIPLLVHGLINPGHILVGRSGSQYVLTNFSVLLAGNATQFIAGIDRMHLSPYAAPEVTYGTIDGRSDLYSLLATAYYLVTGRLPERVNASIPSARRINANVSAEFEAFLVKGLLQVPSRRYQHPAELRLALLTMRSSGSSLMRGYSRQSEQVPQAFLLKSLQSQAQVLPGSLLQEQPHLSDWRDEEEEHHRLLPRPENLPMMRRGHDTLNATLWLLTILVTMIAVIILAKGTF